MRFEWDEEKNRRNIAKHGLGFARAVRIFEGPTLDRIDDRKDYGEERIISIGRVEEVLILVVVHTNRPGGRPRIRAGTGFGVTRIISARPAKRAERKIYEEALQKGALG